MGPGPHPYICTSGERGFGNFEERDVLSIIDLVSKDS